MTEKLQPKYKIDTYYAITIQPDDKIQFCGTDHMARINKFRQYYYSMFQDYKAPYYINIEISEPLGSLPNKSVGPRLHIHGIIKFNTKKQILKFLLVQMHTILKQARLEISEINDKTAWWKYIHKQKLLPKEYKTLSNYDTRKYKRQYYSTNWNKYETQKTNECGIARASGKSLERSVSDSAPSLQLHA